MTTALRTLLEADQDPTERLEAAKTKDAVVKRKPPYPIIATPKNEWPTDNTSKKLSKSEGIALLKKLDILKVGDLDRWIYSHVILDGADKGNLMSRYAAIKYLVGEHAAAFIMHDLATDQL